MVYIILSQSAFHKSLLLFVKKKHYFQLTTKTHEKKRKVYKKCCGNFNEIIIVDKLFEIGLRQKINQA